MKIKIAPKVFEKFHPQFEVAFILARGVDNVSRLKESLHLLGEAEQYVHLTFHKENVRNHYLISPWAVAREEFGKKARHYQTSVEKLLGKVLARKNIKAGDTLTNLCRYLSLKHILPAAVDDLGKIEGDLVFSLSSGREKKGPLKGMPAGTLYYHDNKDILGTKLDYWKSGKTALDGKTRNVLIHIEALPPVTPQKLKEVAAGMESLVKNFCGGQTKVFILSKRKKEGKI